MSTEFWIWAIWFICLMVTAWVLSNNNNKLR